MHHPSPSAHIPRGVLFVASDVDPIHELDYNRWYDREHLLERVSIPGFVSGTRYCAIDAVSRYLGLYVTESLAAFSSPEYRRAFLEQTPWSVQNLDRMRKPARRVCQALARTGAGQGSALMVVRLPVGLERLDLELQVLALGAHLCELDGFVQSCLLLPDEALSTPLPRESTEGRVLSPILLLHASSVDAARALGGRALQQLRVDETATGLYALGWHLHAADL